MSAVAVAVLLVQPVGAQQVSDLMRLTVPADQLPAGCQLLVAKKSEQLPTNPAIVRDPRFLGMMHALIFGPLPGDEAFVEGELTPARARALAERTSVRAETVEVGYAASYGEEGGFHEIGVFALRLKDPSAATPAPASQRSARITKGSVVIFSWADGRPASPDRGCLDVVRRHLASVDIK
jgi:hypothetical protein